MNIDTSGIASLEELQNKLMLHGTEVKQHYGFLDYVNNLGLRFESQLKCLSLSLSIYIYIYISCS
ncbi:hypothetical protein CsSME_00006362 [Camellia sinensis var. sinensis]